MSDNNETQEKPLEKLTVKELREIAGGIDEITGVHGMKKDELVAAIKKVRGIADDAPKAAKTEKVKKESGPVDVKGKIQYFKSKRTEALTSGDRKAAKILQRRINRLKKKSRRAA
jgi:ethanolamine ammonia-lyase large subunit